MAKFYKIAGITAIASLCIGIILVVTGLLFGGRHSLNSFWLSNAEMTTKSYTEVKAFNSIDIDVDSAKVVIEHGKNYGIEYKLIGDEDDIKCEVTDGTLMVSDDYDDTGFHIFWHWSDDSYLTVYVPENVDLDTVKIDSDAGNIKINGIVADEFKIDSDAGNITVKNITCTDGIKIDTDAGNINVDGKLGGDSKITSNCGNVNVKTDYSADMYDYDADTSLGHSDVKSSNGDSLPDSDNNGNYKMTVKTDVGNVEITFK